VQEVASGQIRMPRVIWRRWEWSCSRSANGSEPLSSLSLQISNSRAFESRLTCVA
jgi:hypothetical protein